MSEKKKKTKTEIESKKPALSVTSALLLVSLFIIFATVLFSYFGVDSEVKSQFPYQKEEVIDEPKVEIVTEKQPPEPADDYDENRKEGVCEEYDTESVPLFDFLEEYETIEGDTFTEISLKIYGNLSKASDIKDTNIQFALYELDDRLPSGAKIYLPDEKYSYEDVRNIIVSSGNLSISSDGQKVSVTSATTSSSSFEIDSMIEEKLKWLDEGDCVIMEYTNGGFEREEIFIDIYPQ